MKLNPDFSKAFANFIKLAQGRVDKYFDKHDFPFETDKLVVEPRGRRYKKVAIVRHDGSKSVHSFVEVETGDIFKPASWKAPAKHARGNIYKDNGAEALNEFGNVRYLK